MNSRVVSVGGSLLAAVFVGATICFTILSVAQNFLITDFQMDELGAVTVSHGSDTNAYYILQRDQFVSTTGTVVDLQLGQVFENILGDDVGDNPIGFFNVLRVDLNTPRDSDLDGIDDVFELQQGMDPLDASDAMEDPDADGFGTVYEYIHDSNPNDGTSTPDATLYVNVSAASGGDGSEGAPLDTIQAALDAGGTYDIIQVADGAYTGEGNRELDFLGKPMMLISASGPQACIIDCEDRGRGFHFHSGEDMRSVLRGVTIRNGRPIRVPYDGGGILCSSSSPTIRDCVIETNRSTFGQGGGVSAANSFPTFENCTIANNTTPNDGGGIYTTDSSPTFKNCTIVDNTTRNNGGGVYIANSSATFENCTIGSNTTPDDGGGIYNWNSDSVFQNCDIAENRALNNGAGVYNFESDPTFENCTIVDNRASDSGGGIFNSFSDPILNNCVVANNTASRNAGGIFNTDKTGFTMHNSILWGNIPEQISGDPDTTTVRYSNIQGGWAWAGKHRCRPSMECGLPLTDTFTMH